MFRIIVAVAAVVTILALVGVASADSTHFKKGSPVFGDVQKGTTCTSKDEGKITASGAIAGLGNGDVLISVDVTPADFGCTIGSASGTTFSCTNPGQQDKVPGQNPATISGSLAIPAKDVKNGTLTFAVSTLTTVPGAPGCPNDGWTQGVDSIAASSVTLTIKQGGTAVLTTTCEPPAAPSDNGQTWTC